MRAGAGHEANAWQDLARRHLDILSTPRGYATRVPFWESPCIDGDDLDCWIAAAASAGRQVSK